MGHPCTEPKCKFVGKTAAGLAGHRRLKHGITGGPLRRATEETIRILESTHRLEDVDAARVQILRSLADAIDKDPTNAQMFRTYREAIEDLMRADDTPGDDLDKELAEIRSAGPMGDTTQT